MWSVIGDSIQYTPLFFTYKDRWEIKVMYFALKSDCYFRKYDDIGYISRPIVGMEEVVDEIGAIFLEQLEYEPKSIECLVEQLCKIFQGENYDCIKNDAVEFYKRLSEDDFLNSSDILVTYKDEAFDYSTLKGRLAYKNLHSRNEQSSEIFLGEYSKGNPFLQNFHIELTSKCNERCIHCYIPHAQKNTDIEYDLMMNVLEQCRKMGVMTLVFSGGEPMLHPDFCKFVRRAKDLDFNVTILSNLTVLNDEIISSLKYRHVSCVNVSLYSMEPDIHDEITTINGSFEKTKKNILKLIENNIAVQINCPVMKQNKYSFHQVINWGQDHKCSVVTDYLIMGRSDRSIDNLDNRLTKDDLKYVIEKIAENSLVFRTNLKNEGVFAEGKTSNAEADERVCGVALSTVCMVANGDVYPCAGWQQYVCGNLREQTLESIWYDSPKIKYLRGIRLKEFEKCVGCEDYKYCLMCVSRNYNESPNSSMFDIPQISCDGARIHHEVSDEMKRKYGLL